MRLDRLLYQLRFARSRTAAQRWIGEGRIRLNAERVRQDQPVEVGDVLTLPFARDVLVVELLELPVRRGPPAEARACYRLLDAGGTNRLAGAETQRAEGEALP